jgi:predicted regulator of Ras-like GTPase activity (Roadblock/LC7/MglB family)
MSTVSAEAAKFDWLLGNFVKSVPGVRHTLVVSADGLLMAMSDELDRSEGDRLAAIVSGLSSLTRGAARQLRAGAVRQAIVEMDELFLFTTSISDGSVLAVAANASCDVGLVGYEMTLLVTRPRRR